MNPDLPPNPREELEAKVTALLLGELSAEEAASVREIIAKDAELARLRDRLSLTLDLLRETAATPVGETPAQPAPLKLSPARREKLLAYFKTIRPKEFAPPPRRKTSWVVLLGAAAAVALMLYSLLTPELAGVHEPTWGSHLSLHQSLARAKTKSLHLMETVGNDHAGLNQPAPASVAPPQPSGAYAVNIAPPPPASAPSANQIFLPQTGEQQLADANGQFIAPAQTEALQNQNSAQNSVLQNNGQQFAQANSFVNNGSVQLGDNPVGGGGGGGRFAFQSIQNVNRNEPAPPSVTPAPVAAPAPGGIAGTVASTMEAGGARARATDFIQRRMAEEEKSAQPMAQGRMGVAPTMGAAPAFRYRPPTETRGFGVQTGTGGSEITAAISPIPASNMVTLSRLLAKEAAPTVDSLKFGSAEKDKRAKADTSGMYFDKDSRQLSVVSGDLTAPASPPAEAPKSFKADMARIEAARESLQPIPSAGKQLDQSDAALPHPARPAPVPQAEVQTRDDAFTTFSLNVSDVAFKLAAASLQNGAMPEAASMRSEEFINAFDYRDPEPAPGAPIGFAWERAGYPFAHNRDLLRFSIKTAAQGRQAGRPLNLVLLLDKSGSMERADRVEIIAQALGVLASQLQPQDTISVVVFARTARLWVDGVPGSQAGAVARDLRGLTPEGGTNLEEAMKLAYATALRHYLANGENRVVLLTDGAANLGNVEPDALKQRVETNHKQGIAFDCFGVGWDGYNDTLLETLSRAGNGRYGFINTPEEAATEFAGNLAGALRVAAADVKVQVEFNSNRVTSYRQIGYAKDQLTKEQFRDNSVSAAQIGAAESGNALYTVEINPSGDGPLCTVHVRFRVPGTSDYQEHEWTVPYTGSAVSLEKANPAMRLAATAAAFSEWLAASPYAGEVTPDRLLVYLSGVPQVSGADARPAKLEWMIRQAKSISGK
jgi:Mg-chelatase subunit ChlD/anti-sigma factor RsiW